MAHTFQGMLSGLQAYWEEQGCTIMQPYHTEVGAGTSNPATFLRVLGTRPWRTAYVEPSIRPDDGRYGENPFRFQQFYQYQVILKPAPADIQDLYLASLQAIGIDVPRHDVRQMSAYNYELADVEVYARHFDDFEAEARRCIEAGLPLPAYDCVL